MQQKIVDQTQSLFDQTNTVRDTLLLHFEPLSDVVYMPTKALAEISGFSETNVVMLITFQMGLILSFGFNFLTRPKDRKMYSAITGLFLGFYMHGLGYLVCLLQFSCFYPFLLVLPRR